MSDVIGRGVIELSADGGKLKAGIDDARRTIKSFGKDMTDSVGTASKGASLSIDRYVKSLQTAAATQGRSTREAELYKLALRGASDAQLGAANSALKLAEGYQRGQVLGAQLRTGFIAVAAAAVAAAAAVGVGTIALISQVGKYQDLGEKVGDTAVNISSLKTAADVSGTSIDTIATASVRLTAALSKTDDESKLVGESIKALGIDFGAFKKQSPVEQLETVARAFGSFADDSKKSAVAVGIFGKSGAELLGFLKEYAEQGRTAAYITAEQAKAADDYSDASARLKSQIEQFLQVSAVSAIPVLVEIGDLFRSIGKSQEGAAGSTDLIKSAIGGLVTIFQAVVGIGADLVFVFKGVGNEIGAIAAQLAALAHLDFKGFSAIGDAVKDDAARARAELDKFQARLLAIGKPSIAFQDPRILGNPGTIAEQTAANRPRLNISGLSRDKAPRAGAGRDTASQEAKAQLAFDLDQIRKAQEAVTNTIANSEKINEALRGASLESEADYYAKKRGFLIANNAAQESALQAEIDRLQRENLAGKDRIDNDRRIADAQSKLAKVRENAGADLQVLAIREKAALDDIARGYTDAQNAAAAYLDTIRRANARDIAGVGAGQKARDNAAAIGDIEERFQTQRDALQRDNRNGKFAGRADDYQRELALLESSQATEITLYRAKYETLDQLQRNWANGAHEALQNYIDDSANTAKQTEGLFSRSLQGFEDALVEFSTTGKLTFKSLADSIIADLVRMQYRAALGQIIGTPTGQSSGGGGGGGILGSLIGAAVSYFGGGSSGMSTNTTGGQLPTAGGRALGGPVSAGGLYQINEGGRPEVFEAGGKQYLMTGSQSGNVNAQASAPSQRAINVNINQSFAPGTTRSTADQAAAAAGREAARSLNRGNA